MHKKLIRGVMLGAVITALISAGCISQVQLGSHSCNVVTYEVVVQSLELTVDITVDGEPLPQEEPEPAYAIITVANPETGEALAARAHPIPPDGEEHVVSGEIVLDTIPESGTVAVGVKFQASADDPPAEFTGGEPEEEPEEYVQVVALSCDDPLRVEYPAEWTPGVKKLDFGPDHPMYSSTTWWGASPCGLFDVMGHGPKQVSLADYPACQGQMVDVYCLDDQGEWVDDNITGLRQEGDLVMFTSSQHGGCGFFPDF